MECSVVLCMPFGRLVYGSTSLPVLRAVDVLMLKAKSEWLIRV